MANQLKMAAVDTILTLYGLGWSQRRIAGELGIDRETVARYIHSAPTEAKPATNQIPGSEAAGPACDATSPGPESLCEPFRAVIEEKLRQGLTGVEIVSKVGQKGLGIGIHFPGHCDLQVKWAQRGLNIILHSSDTMIFERSLGRDISAIRNELGEGRP
jgi:hypothetical protein